MERPDGHRGRQLRARLGADEGRTPSPKFKSELVVFLLQQWAWGHLSAPEVQIHALKAYRDQVALLNSMNISEDRIADDLRRLAKLGSWGGHKQNIHSNLCTWLGNPNCPSYFLHKVPLYKMKHDGSADTSIITEDFAMFLPHVYFSWFYHNDKRRFSRLFSGGLDGNARKEFWRELKKRKDPRLDVHPMTQTRGWEKVTIALLLHGDGVPVLQIGRAGTKSFETYSIQSVFTSGPSKEVKLLIFGLFADSICPSTMQEIWRIMCWSFYFLAEGRWPDVDWNNAPWTDAHPFFEIAYLRCV